LAIQSVQAVEWFSNEAVAVELAKLAQRYLGSLSNGGNLGVSRGHDQNNGCVVLNHQKMLARINTIVQALGKLEAEYQRDNADSNSQMDIQLSHSQMDIQVSHSQMDTHVSHSQMDTQLSHSQMETQVSSPTKDIQVSSPTKDVQVSSPTKDIQVMDMRMDSPLNQETLQTEVPKTPPLKVRTDVTKTDKKLKTPTEDPEKKRIDNWKRSALMIWQKMLDHRAGNSFMKIPRDLDVNAIKEPMCLETIRSRIQKGVMASNAGY
jgi:hypothetical protein